MKIIKLEVGQLGANCYIVYCERTLQGMVVDPGGDAEKIIAVLNRERITVTSIVNTHGHADHIAGNDQLKTATGAPVLIHEEDAKMLLSPQGNLSMYIGNHLNCQAADRLLIDGDILVVGEMKFEVLHTPGHTRGGICIYGHDVVFSGDTLFEQSVGRTDFPGGSHSQLMSSIKAKLFVLTDGTVVLPGHGENTTIGVERQTNPFIQ